MNIFIRAMVRIFSFGERWNVQFNDNEAWFSLAKYAS